MTDLAVQNTGTVASSVQTQSSSNPISQKGSFIKLVETSGNTGSASAVPDLAESQKVLNYSEGEYKRSESAYNNAQKTETTLQNAVDKMKGEMKAINEEITKANDYKKTLDPNDKKALEAVDEKIKRLNEQSKELVEKQKQAEKELDKAKQNTQNLKKELETAEKQYEAAQENVSNLKNPKSEVKPQNTPDLNSSKEAKELAEKRKELEKAQAKRDKIHDEWKKAENEKFKTNQLLKRAKAAVDDMQAKNKNPIKTMAKYKEALENHKLATERCKALHANYKEAKAAFNTAKNDFDTAEKAFKALEKKLAENAAKATKNTGKTATEVAKNIAKKFKGKGKIIGLALAAIIAVGGWIATQCSKDKKTEENENDDYELIDDDDYDSTVENDDDYDSTVENDDDNDSTVENDDDNDSTVENDDDNDSTVENDDDENNTNENLTDVKYEVKKGDCVWNIARKELTQKNGVEPTGKEILARINEIVAENGLKWDDSHKFILIKPNQILKGVNID